ncbi:hypothetical protein ACBP89_27960, partial [Aneurinibacillus aneurinilyticus]
TAAAKRKKLGSASVVKKKVSKKAPKAVGKKGTTRVQRKVGKVFTDARKLKNNLTQKERVKKLKSNEKAFLIPKKPSISQIVTQYVPAPQVKVATASFGDFKKNEYSNKKYQAQKTSTNSRAQEWNNFIEFMDFNGGPHSLSPGRGSSLKNAKNFNEFKNNFNQKPNNNSKPTQGKGNTGWDMIKGGSTINGRRYSEHALERMAPNTPQVRAELEKRALEKGLKRGTKAFNDFVQPRGVPPMVVENVIKSVKPTPGKNPGTLDYIGNGVKVVTNKNGDVITVILSSGGKK